jgi:hypothetical protein
MMKWIKVILPLLALSAVGLFYWPQRPTYLPEKLWGVWKTDNDRYADRYLDISEAIFTIGQGREHLQVFFFQRADMTPVGAHERHTIYYREHEGTKEPLQTFTFDFFTTDEGDRLQLKNQKDIIWYRDTNREPTVSRRETATP